jgi:polyisoprenyl-phosphate glycosyltransferase
MMKTSHGSTFLLSVVVPCFNEEEVIGACHERLVTTLKSMPVDFEIVYINDGSTDGTIQALKDIKNHEPRVAIIDFSRNFGKEIALSAGLDHARGDAVVVIDADLQDPPELIPELYKTLLEGYDVVYARRQERNGETFFKKLTARYFYRVMRILVKPAIPEDTGDFRILSRRAVDTLKKFREQHRFMKGLFAWIGYPQKEIVYNRDARLAGKTKWNYWKLWNFALEGITSFSIEPLKVSTYLGLLTAVFAFVYALFIVYKTIVFGEPVRGYPSLMVVILFLGGVQLTVLGILGEYMGRIFNETKNRPLYIVKDYIPAEGKAICCGSNNESDKGKMRNGEG